MNWALVDTGSFDYAADAWGYTYGAAAEWYQRGCSVRLRPDQPLVHVNVLGLQLVELR